MKIRSTNIAYPNIIIAILLAILPFLFFSEAARLNEKRGPLWLANNFDPSYAYLFNSLGIVNGHPPTHTDHPGTTAQIMGAVILRIRHPLAKTADLTRMVLLNPEPPLKLIILTINGLTASLLFILGLLVWKNTGDLALPVLFQSALLFFDLTYLNSVYFRPELIFPPLCLCLAYIYFRYHAHDISNQLAAVTGGLAACCLMNKYTYLPFVVLGLFFFRSNRAKIAYGTTFLVTVGLLVYIIRHNFPQAWSFFHNLVTHAGTHGEGAEQFINWDTLIPNFLRLIHSDPLYTPLLVSGIVAPLLTLFRLPVIEAFKNRTNRALITLTFLEFGCFLITAKRPMLWYMTPVVTMAPLHLLLLGKTLKDACPNPFTQVAVISLIVVSGLYFGGKEYTRYGIDFTNYAAGQIETTKVLSTYLETNRQIDYVPVFYYRSSSLKYSLAFGNDCSDQYFATDLAKLYPHAWFFNIWNARFSQWNCPGDKITSDDFYGKNPHPLFFGSGYITNGEGLPPPLPAHGTLKKVWEGSGITMHIIDYK